MYKMHSGNTHSDEVIKKFFDYMLKHKLKGKSYA
jgi:hypothetical protein